MAKCIHGPVERLHWRMFVQPGDSLGAASGYQFDSAALDER